MNLKSQIFRLRRGFGGQANLKSRKGQSLVEIIIALAIGSIIIGSASAALVVILRSGTTAEIQRSATALAQDYIEKTRAYARADWHNIYNLTKGSSTTYYFNTSSTEIFTISGEEGVIANDIRGGLVGYWKFDEESGNTAYDSSGNNNDGTLQSGVVRATSSCKASDCLSFDGADDYVSVSDNSVLDIVEQVTLSAWIKPQTPLRDYLSKAWNLWRIILNEGGTNNVKVVQRIGGTDITTLSENDVIVAGNWHHVVYTYDGSETQIYINGQKSGAPVSASGSLFTNSSNLLIGSWSTRYYSGEIDEVRIYNRALSADDIDHLYNSSIFTRSFYIENVCRRTDDGSYDIIGVAPCGAGSVNDPSTQKVNVTVGREESGSASQFVISDFITRWKNSVFPQSDWSGGENPDQVVTEPDNQYSSSTEIDVSIPGSFRIEGI